MVQQSNATIRYIPQCREDLLHILIIYATVRANVVLIRSKRDILGLCAWLAFCPTETHLRWQIVHCCCRSSDVAHVGSL